MRIGEIVVVRSEDGRLAAEYALFDPGEVVLQAVDRLTVHEEGYLTSAGDARERLAALGITPDLAADAARALPRDVVVALARSDSAARLASRLGAGELFDGSTYSAANGEYAGAWLDLASLGRATGVRDAAASMQALYLATLLSEVDEDAPVHLSTMQMTQGMRSGERTHHRPAIMAAKRLPQVFAQLRMTAIRPKKNEEAEQSLRSFLLRGIRERATAAAHTGVRERIESLESALVADDRSPEVEVSEPRDGYLRAKAELERGEGKLKSIAEMLSELADPKKHEITLLAARAWLAAGDEARAKEFALRITSDPGAPESVRLSALDLLELRSRHTPASTKKVELRHDQTIPGASRPPHAIEDAPTIVMPPRPRVPAVEARRLPAASDTEVSEVIVEAEVVEPRAPTAPMPTPVPPAMAPEIATSGLRPTYDVAEVVESMALPAGLGEEMLPVETMPHDAKQARIAMTRMARDLARDYRTIYRTILKTDVMSIDLMQRHLRRRFAEGQEADAEIASELLRHGALLSEILARRIGGVWVDVAPTEVGYWAMIIPPQTRIWPIGRVFRFFSLGHRERDLVGYYLELEALSRRQR